MDLNRATILGRLTRDPELKSLESGRSVCSVGVATGRVWTDQSGQKQEQTEFHDVVFWGKIGEVVAQYMRKGSRIYVEGRLQTRDWTGTDGVKRYRTELIANNMIMLDSKGSGGRPGHSDAEPSLAGSNDRSVAPAEVVEEEIKVEDIPF